MKFSRYLLTLVLAVCLTFNFSYTNANAAQIWDYYFGANSGVKGGARGRLISQSPTGWQVYLESVGSIGNEGAKVYSTFSNNSGTDTAYRLSCKLFSSDCNKWVFISIKDSKSEEALYEEWVYLGKGKTVSYQKDLTLSSNSMVVSFGLGGGEKSDTKSSASTSITCSNFSFASKTTTTSSSVKLGKAAIKKIKRSRRKAKITLKKISGAEGYIIKYSTSKKFKSSKTIISSKRIYTIKKLKKNTRYYVKARVFGTSPSTGIKIYGKWSKKKIIPKK